MHKMDLEPTTPRQSTWHCLQPRRKRDKLRDSTVFQFLRDNKETEKSTCYSGGKYYISRGMQVAGWVIARCTGHRKEIFFSNSQGGVSAKTASWIFRRGFMIATVNQKRKTSGGKLPTKKYMYKWKLRPLFNLISFFSFLFFF